METSGSIEPITTQKLPGISVSMQTEASWLNEHAYRKSTLSEEFSSLDVLCDMEFKEDFVKLFKKSLCTLPSVGLPTLLAYRPESSRESIEIETDEDCAPRCEYCGSLLKPFPSFEDACPLSQDYELKFCCKRNQDLYEFIVNERKNHKGAWSVPIAVGPHESHGTEADRLLSKDRAYQRQQERQMARQLAFLAAGPTGVAECSNQAGTISYLLSQEPPSPKGRTLVPGERAAKPEEEPISYSVTCCDFTPVGGKVAKNELLEKYYKHGGKFLTMLPDGTAQLFHPCCFSLLWLSSATKANRGLRLLLCSALQAAFVPGMLLVAAWQMDKHEYSGRAVFGPRGQQGEKVDVAEQHHVIRTPCPAEPCLHLPEPAHGGQDLGPGQDHRFLPRHGATSKIQRGNQSAGQ